MPLIIQPLGKESVDSEISSLTVNTEGSLATWSTYNGLLSIITLENNEKNEFQLDSYGKKLSFISEDLFVVGQEEGNLICFSNTFQKIWEISCPGGCELMESTRKGDLIALIDGTNTLRLINTKGELLSQFSEYELTGLTINENGSAISCWDDEGNLFVLDRKCNLIFKRRINSNIGERIITAKYTQNGILLVSKESLDIPDDGEQNELEFWNPLGQKIGKVGFNSKCVSLNVKNSSIWAGLFSGEVFLIEDFNKKLIWKSEYSITSLIPINNDILVASWFYLFKISKENNESLWQYEHSGIIDILKMSQDQKIVALAGNDRNDYTNPSELVLLNPNATPIWEEESDDEFEEENIIEAETTDIYDNSDDDLKELLGDDFNQYQSTNDLGKTTSMDDLMAAFNEEISSEPKTKEIEDVSLIEHLLSSDEKRNQPPICNAGNDQVLQSGEDGSCTVILDGSSSHDPDGYIRTWNWTSEDGRTLSSGPKLKLRLPIGNHRFTLTVADDDGAMSSDSVSIIIK
tara:strand:- start:2189 stop:3745 length:1557 start_codon:yes stop_codon:yes gene_type:complete